MVALGSRFSGRCASRARLTDAILDIRVNEFDNCGDRVQVRWRWRSSARYDQFPRRQTGTIGWRSKSGTCGKRVLKRIDVTLALAGRADRAGLVLCRHARGTGLSATTAPTCLIGRAKGDNKPPAAVALADVNLVAYPMSERPGRAREPVPRRSCDPRSRARRGRKDARRRDGAEARPRHLRARRHRTGRTRCACSSKSARVFRRTVSPASKPICVSPDPRPWNRNLRPPHRLAELDLPAPETPSASEGALRRYGTGQKPVFRHEKGVMRAANFFQPPPERGRTVAEGDQVGVLLTPQ